MRIVPENEISKMACPRKILVIKCSKDKSYLAQKMQIMQNLHDRRSIAVKKKHNVSIRNIP